jgi:hypothetical protein
VLVESFAIQRYVELRSLMLQSLPTMLDLAQWELLQAHFQDLLEMLSTSYGYVVVLLQLMKQLSIPQ